MASGDKASVDKGVRARSFGALADAYHRHRPGYPAAAVDWMLEGVPERPEILDLGAGTGKLTASLVDRGPVHAVEPDPEMLAVLRRDLPSVDAQVGSAEAIPLPDASVDAVLVGQALHWFEPEAAYPEIVRVLRPGGVLAALWNLENPEVEWLRGYYEVVGWARHVGKPTDRTELPHPELGPTEQALFDNPIRMTIDALLDNLGTFSWISTLSDAERADTLRQAREYLTACPETGSGPFELPLRTTVLRAHRL